ncbi:MAG: type II toxin-antitoxin system VapC family toxin [Planctomycetaceae bacterium]
MRLLLDTHAFLWFVLDDPQLSSTARNLIEEPANEVEVSPATYWEIAIKIKLGKYALPQPYQEFMEAQLALNDFRILPIEPRHTALLTTMPFHHKDPFDRLLVAQALSESVSMISIDSQLDAYGVQRVW